MRLMVLFGCVCAAMPSQVSALNVPPPSAAEEGPLVHRSSFTSTDCGSKKSGASFQKTKTYQQKMDTDVSTLLNLRICIQYEPALVHCVCADLFFTTR